MHRHQLDGRHAQLFQVSDRRRRRQPRISAAQLSGHQGIQLREPFDVQLVDNRLVPGRARRTIVSPRKSRVGGHRQRRKGRVVSLVERKILALVTEPVTKHRIVPTHIATNRFGIRIEHDLMRIEAMAPLGLVRSMHAISIELARFDVGQIAMPDHVGMLWQQEPVSFLLGLRRIEQTKLDLRGVLRKNCEVDTCPIPRRPQRIGVPWPNSHAHVSNSLISW